MPTESRGESQRPQSRYRPSALKHYQSSERLDRTATTTDAKGWIGIVVGFAVVLLALSWGIWGGIPNQVEMQVEMTRAGAFSVVSSDSDGTVSRLLVSPGETVSSGTVLVAVDTANGTASVVSGVSGTIQGLSVSVGAQISVGDQVATVVDDSSAGELQAVTYVDSSDAVELRTLPDSLVSPHNVDASQYGSLIGKVTFVADIPATLAEMTATLQSETLAGSLLETTRGVPYLVLIGFDAPPLWTNDQEPPFDIVDGTPADAIATIGVERPIDLLFGG